MPAGKKKGKGGGGSGKKKKKGAKAAAEKEEIVKLCKSLLKSYQLRCAATESMASPRICQEIRNSIENEIALSKFVLEPSQAAIVRPAAPSRQKSRGPSAAVPSATTPAQPSSTNATTEATATSKNKDVLSPRSGESTKPSPPPILLQPLINSWAEVKYSRVRCLHVWSMELVDDAIVTLALFLESPLGPNIQVLELREAKLSSWSINRLAKSLTAGSQLTTLNLDFNPPLSNHDLCRIDCASFGKFCECLQRVPTLSSLSLNFCQLDSNCGEPLGMLTATSQIKELSLIGNHLECNGFNEFLRPLVSLSESHMDATTAPLVQDHVNTNKTELTRAQPQAPPNSEAPPRPPDSQTQAPPIVPQATPIVPQDPPPMPPLAKLFFQDNCIDVHGECTDMDGVFASVLCMRALKRFVVSSPLLEEINVEGNWIGEGGAREVMLALQQRKGAGLPAMKLRVSSRICPEIFAEIMQLTVSSEGAKKRRSGKGKKKRK